MGYNDVDNVDYKGYCIAVKYDEAPENPREWDNIGRMVCFHGRYTLGDEHDYDTDDFETWAELAKQIKADNDIAVILPVYMYEHSDISLSTSSFNCQWDSGQVGFIYATKEDVRENWRAKRVSANMIEDTKRMLVGEIKVYSAYVNGECYGFDIYNPNGECIDGCYGFYSMEDAKRYARHEIDYIIKAEKKRLDAMPDILIDSLCMV